MAQYALPLHDASLIAAERELADLFEGAVRAGADAKPVANWIIGEVAPGGSVPTITQLADVVKLVSSGSITRDQGREVLAESIRSQRSAGELVAERGFAQVSDESELEAIVRDVIAANPKAAADYQAGKKQALGALMAALKKKAPQANPKIANELLQKLLQ